MFNLKTDPATRTAKRILDYALSDGATEIHCELGDPSRVRFRTDGLLRDVFDYTPEDLRGIIGAITRHAQMPQDGKGQFVYRTPQGSVRFHTYLFTTANGEHLVLRPLHEVACNRSLADLGLHEDHERFIREQLTQPGLILVSAPPGSGATATLNALAGACNPEKRSIVTIGEEGDASPDGIQHVPVNRRLGFDYAKALRALLRHHPDVIALNDLPDAETEQLALHAAAGGTTVLANIVTPDHITPSLLGRQLLFILVQRLLPAVCRACHDTYPLDDHSRTQLASVLKDHPLFTQLDDAEVYRSRGCNSCRADTAPSCGIFAVCSGNEVLNDALTRRLLIADGFSKALKGIVNIDHVLSLS